MPRLAARLLGAFQVELDEQPVGGYSSAKVRALLAFLLMERERPHSRDELCGLLWPDEHQEVAQANLRQALANLRQVLGDRTATTPFLTVTRESIRLAEEADCSVDVQEFLDRLDRCRLHNHRRPEACALCIERLDGALRLYRGDFLDGLYIDAAPEYDAWAAAQRERVRSNVLAALSTLAEHYLLTGKHDLAGEFARRQLELEPWHEEAHCQLMRSCVLAGNRSAALNQFETCRRIMAAEFHAEPSAETQALLR
ncbi:MAG: SARP family transcriptional regulator, partial [Chloroflexi bacterium]|nr:SARP family transcriptional regulator [Chloroflexota bacterium]